MERKLTVVGPLTLCGCGRSRPWHENCQRIKLTLLQSPMLYNPQLGLEVVIRMTDHKPFPLSFAVRVKLEQRHPTLAFIDLRQVRWDTVPQPRVAENTPL